MTVQTSHTGHPHLTLVTDAAQAAFRASADFQRTLVRYAVGAPLDEIVPQYSAGYGAGFSAGSASAGSGERPC